MVFRYSRRVQFAETDMAGIVHFSSYFKYMEEAEHALWRAVGLDIVDPTWTPATGPPGPRAHGGFPRVSASCEYLAPLHFEDEIEVQVVVAEISRRSIRYTHTIVQGEITIATGAMTVVCVEHTPDGMRAVTIPADIVEKLRPYAA